MIDHHLETRSQLRGRHIDELQTLRGIAALVVAVSHISTVYAVPNVMRVAIDSVLNAHAAIVVFFVLSGYVLTGALVRRGITSLAVMDLYISRIFRLFPAMWTVSALSAVLLFAVPSLKGGPALSSWFLGYLHSFPSPIQLVLSLVAVDSSLIMPIWTVFIEIIGSTLMPILVAVALWRPRLFPWLVLLLGCAAYLLAHAPHRLNAFGFVFEFALGVLIATNRFRFTFCAPVPTTLAASAVLVFFRPAWFGYLNGGLMPLTVGYEDPIPMILEALAASVLISALADGHGKSKLLTDQRAIRLGDISYSLYLVHFPIGICMAKLLSGWLPSVTPAVAMIILLSASIPISLFISDWLFQFVERPANEFGKNFHIKLVNRHERRIEKNQIFRHLVEEKSAAALDE